MSVPATALASVSVSVAPESDGEPLSVTVCSLPPCGVFFTVKAPFARFAAAARFSLKMTVSFVPDTTVLRTVGRTPSTLWLPSAATAGCRIPVAGGAFSARSAIAPPFSASPFWTTDMPSVSASPSATV